MSPSVAARYKLQPADTQVQKKESKLNTSCASKNGGRCRETRRKLFWCPDLVSTSRSRTGRGRRGFESRRNHEVASR